MPVIRTPSGRKLRVPDDATQEQIMAVLQASGEIQDPAAAAPPPAPAPTPTAAPPAPVPAPVGGPPATTAATPPPTPPGGAPATPAMPWQPGNPEFDAEFQRLQAENVAGMSGVDKFISGAGQSVDSSVRGVRQLWNYLSGDDAEYSKLKEDENEARRMDQALLNTGAGRSGQIAGHIAQAALPAGAVAKGAKAAQLGLTGTIAAEAALGAGMGAMQPVAGDESRGVNAAVGGALGAAFPIASKLAQLPMSAKAALLRTFAPKGTGGVTDVVARLGGKAERVRAAAGKQISKLVDDVRVPVGKDLAAKLRGVQRDYGRALPPVARKRINDLIELADSQVTHLKGSAAQTARSDFGKEAAASEGFRQSGLNKAKRIMDEALEGSMSKSKARQLRAAREQWRTGQKAVSPVSPGRTGARGLAQALRAGTVPAYDDDETRN